MADNWIIANRSKLAKRNYIRTNKNAFVDIRFSAKKLSRYKKEYGEEFNLVIVGSPKLELDFYVLPYSRMRDLLTEKFIDERNSWHVTIKNHRLRVREHNPNLDCREFYGTKINLDD